jgi:hypothetical protein
MPKVLAALPFLQVFELLACVALAGAWLIPNHYPPWTSVYNEALAGIGLALLLVARIRYWTSSALPNSVWIIFSVAAIPGLQWTLGLLHFSGDVWVSSLYMLCLSVGIAVGALRSQASAKNAAVLLSGATFLSASVSSLFVALQALHADFSGVWSVYTGSAGRPAANLGQPNNLATLLGFGAVSLLLLREHRKVGSAVAAIMLTILLVGAAFTQSRTSLFFGLVVFAGVWLAKKRGVPFKTDLSTVAIATLLHWALMLAWPTLQATLLLSGSADSMAQRGLETPRLQMWPMLLHAASLSPWYGYGWLQVGAAELAVGELWLHGHNLFLELVLWCGYPLGLALVAVILYWYVTRLGRVRTVEGVVGMLIVSVFGVHAMLELPHHYAYFLIPLGLWIGQVETSIGSRQDIPAGLVALPVALAALIAFAVLRDYPAIEEDFRVVRFENLRIGSVRATHTAPDAPFLSSLTGFLRFARMKPAAGMSTEALATMQFATERYPYAPSLARLAAAWALNGRLDDGTQAFLKIRKMYGEGTFRRLRTELRNRIEEGQTALTPLYASLPE